MDAPKKPTADSSGRPRGADPDASRPRVPPLHPDGDGIGRPGHDGTASRLQTLERERDESNARFDALVEGNADGIIVLDEHGTILFANQTAAGLFGLPLDRLVGSSFGHPQVCGQTTEVDLLPKGRPPLVVEMRVVEVEWKGGHACLATLRDITDRKRAEESARELIRADTLRAAAEAASARFRFLADAGATLASSLDPAATMATLARLCVTQLADWAVVYRVADDGRVERQLVVHRDPGLADTAARLRELPMDAYDARPVHDVLRTGEPFVSAPYDSETRARLTDRPERLRLVEELGLASFILLPLAAHDGPRGAIALIRSDSERPFDEDDLSLALVLAGRAGLALDNARLYQAARAADQAKTDLIAVISHDLRTPLNSIIGYADLLDLGVHDTLSRESLGWVKRIRRSAEHQVHLIDQLLTFSRLDSGAQVRPVEVDVVRLLDDVRTMIEPIAQHAGLTLVQRAGDAGVVRTDPDMLRQIVVNLATNAIKYTEQGGIELEAEREDGTLRIRVTDTGIGIAPEHLERIFDPFWQVDPARRGTVGTGLGLSIVRRLARALGGDIEVASTAGRGSTFTVRLPVCSGGTERPDEQG